MAPTADTDDRKNNLRKKWVESRQLACFTSLTNALIRFPCLGDKLREIICFLPAVEADTSCYLPSTEIICSAVPRVAQYDVETSVKLEPSTHTFKLSKFSLSLTHRIFPDFLECSR
jgi:hypothetical protein